MLLSAAIIVRDEAELLDACLTSLDGLADEIVVVDTGSVDDSVEVARRHGAVIGHEPWRGDFSTPRNHSLDLATGEWILYIDADERVITDDRDAVREVLAAATDHVSFRVRFVPRVSWTPYQEFRLWRHRPDIRFAGEIHETMVPAIHWVHGREGLLVSDLDDHLPGGLTIEHFGYEGDQRHKHARNEPMLRAAMAASPDHTFLYDHLARIYEDLGRPQDARATWRAGMDVARARGFEHPDDRLLWINLLVHAVAHEDPDDDVPALIQEASERYPGNPAVEFARASHEFATGDPASALRRSERLVVMEADEIIATGSAYDARIFGEWSWHTIGLCKFALGDHAGAAEAFQHAEQLNPTNDAYKARRLLAEARAQSG